MPANEFEKQVQQQLDEFQLNPSASVWERVEEELRDKRKRRVIYFFLLPGLIALLGFSLYYFLDSGKKSQLASNSIAKKEAISTKTQSSTDRINPSGKTNEKINAPVNTKNGTDAITVKDPVQNVEEGKEDVADPKSSIITNRKLNISYPSTNTRRINIERPAKKAQIVETPTKKDSDRNVPGNDKRAGENNVPVAAVGVPTAINPKTDVKDPATSGKNDQPKENVQANSKDSVTKLPDSLAAAVVKTSNGKKPKSKKSSKVKWGIDFYAGASFVQTGMWAWEGAPQLGPMSAIRIPFSPGLAANPRSEVKPGFSFRIGVSGEWKISDRSSFSSGLLYDYASDNIKVGSATDTTLPRLSSPNATSSFNSVGSYTIYQGAATEDHTNSFHYISLPLEYHYLLNKKIKLQWDLGLAIKYLVATNALIYTQSYGGIYYEDKDAFFKTHCTMGTGFSFRIKSKKGVEWVTGPELMFDLTRILKNDQHKDYFVFTGLNTKVYFPKKKAK